MRRRGRHSSTWFSVPPKSAETPAATPSWPVFPTVNIPRIPPTDIKAFDQIDEIIENDTDLNPDNSGALLDDLSGIQFCRSAVPLSHDAPGLYPSVPKIDILPDTFPAPEPQRPNLQPPPDLRPKPQIADFKKPLTFFDKLFSYRAGLKFIKWEAEHRAALEIWEGDNAEYQERKAAYDTAMRAFASRHGGWLAAKKAWTKAHTDAVFGISEMSATWQKAERTYLENIALDRARFSKFEQALTNREKAAVEASIRIPLLRTPYPRAFPRTVEISYSPADGIALVELELPNLRDLQIYEKKADRTRTASDFGYKLKPISDAARRKLITPTYCAILLRTIRDIFAVSKPGLVAAVSVNGHVRFIDRATGRTRTEIIHSVFAKRETFETIDIANVDPVVCMRALKGVFVPITDEFTPVPPIMVLNREDGRVVEGKDILSATEAQTNLAAMEWDDFEHLVRQLFEKEFAASAGAEVKVTRASRDYGVDAIVFDPDPIRGGKYVIQAKRYTILVDVAAVRDLYGTVVNEGAVKGLLVTTSHFGPDAYEFAKDKPITLIDGNNLLALFRKHGSDFRIDIEEARRGRN